MRNITDDQETQQHVENALDWAEPTVDTSRIAVCVDGGVVTLRGDVQTEGEKATAERVALLLYGVKGVINELVVRRVEVNVVDGRVILSGCVHSSFEREEARRTAGAAPGVTVVVDRLTVVP